MLGALVSVVRAGEDPPGLRRNVEAVVDNRPAVWKQAPGKAAIKAEEVARQDGVRKLLERIYGLKVDANVEVLDLALASARFKGRLKAHLLGMRDKKTVYQDDGSCQKLMEVTMREVVEIVRKSYEKIERKGKIVAESRIERITTENRDKLIQVWGSGALKGSKGLKVIRAQRAAEMDLYRKLAARLMGVQVDATTDVGDFVLVNDQIKSCFAHSLKGTKITDVRVLPDKYVEVDGELTLKVVIERIERTYKRTVEAGKEKVENLKKTGEREEKTVLKETGRGAIEQAGREPVVATVTKTKHYKEWQVIERVLRKEIVVE